MEENKIIEELTPIVQSVFKIKDIVLTPDLPVSSIENWSSLNNFILISEVEKHFSIRFSLRDLSGLKTVGGFISKIAAKIQ